MNRGNNWYQVHMGPWKNHESLFGALWLSCILESLDGRLSLSDHTNQINTVRGWRESKKWRDAGKFNVDAKIMRCHTESERHRERGLRLWGLGREARSDWSDDTGVVSSVSLWVAVWVGDLIDWLPDWRDPAASEWSVYPTVLGQEDCTPGMMGNEGLCRGSP